MAGQLCFGTCPECPKLSHSVPTGRRWHRDGFVWFSRHLFSQQYFWVSMVHCVSSRICACFEKERCGLSTFWIKFALYMSLCGAFIVLLLQIESYYFKVFIYMLYLAYSSHSSGHLLDTSTLYKLYCTRSVPMVCCAFLSTWCTWCTVHAVETSMLNIQFVLFDWCGIAIAAQSHQRPVPPKLLPRDADRKYWGDPRGGHIGWEPPTFPLSLSNNLCGTIWIAGY